MKKDSNSTIAYYDENARKYYDSTLNVDLSGILKRFISHVSEGGKILDAGCGSGRDSLWFIREGYEVVSFDCSRELSRMASNLLGKKVLVQSFLDVEYDSEFDGIWACSSLLHVKKDNLNEALSRLARALKPGGYFYLSFKYGQGERVKSDGRYFVDMDESCLNEVLKETGCLLLTDSWVTEDARPGRRNEFWLNAILNKPK